MSQPGEISSEAAALSTLLAEVDLVTKPETRFTIFNKLPKELRLDIWRLSLEMTYTARLIVVVEGSGTQPGERLRVNAQPSLLEVNQESRSEMLRIFDVLHFADADVRVFWAKDTLLLDGYKVDKDTTQRIINFFPMVRHIALQLPNPLALKKGESTWKLLSHFKHISSIIMYTSKLRLGPPYNRRFDYKPDDLLFVELGDMWKKGEKTDTLQGKQFWGESKTFQFHTKRKNVSSPEIIGCVLWERDYYLGESRDIKGGFLHERI